MELKKIFLLLIFGGCLTLIFSFFLVNNVNAASDPTVCDGVYTDANGNENSASDWCSSTGGIWFLKYCTIDVCQANQFYNFYQNGKHFYFGCQCGNDGLEGYTGCNCNPATAGVEDCSTGQNWTCEQGNGCSSGYCTAPTGCTCGDWVNNTCNAGGCDKKMHQTRSCNPSGCDTESRCIDWPACVLTCVGTGEYCGGYSICCDGLTCCTKGGFVAENRCRNLNIDPSNCGECGKTCASNETCVSGTCVSQLGCGNSVIDPGEACDGNNNLGGKTCELLGLGPGNLKCYPKGNPRECKFDTSECTIKTVCGNNVIESGEECDGTAPVSKACKDFGFEYGTLKCKPSGTPGECTFDKSGCTNVPPPDAGAPAPPGAISQVGTKCEAKFPLKNFKTYMADGKIVAYDGLVPCGKCVIVRAVLDSDKNITSGNPEYLSCQFCHFFVMFKGIVGFITGVLVPVIAVLMLVIGGIMFFFAGAYPDMLRTGKNIIKSVVWGIVIIFAAYMVVNVVLSFIGLADFSLQGFDPRNWFNFPCDVKL